MNRRYQPVRTLIPNLWQVAVDNAPTRSKTATAAALVLSLLSNSALAQSWIDGNVGDWEDGTNWAGGSPPTPGAFVNILQGHATLSSDAGEMDFLLLANNEPTDQATLTLDGPDAALVVGSNTLGFEGDATLEVLDGGLLSAPRGLYVGGFGGGADILLSGSAGRRGTLEVREIDRSTNSSGAFLTFDGGVLRVVYGFGFFDPDILEGWAEDITLNAGGGFIDSNGYNISLSETLTGAGGLTKLGAGTLSLEGNNTYSGGTVVDAGTLQIGAGGTTGGLGSGNITNNTSLVFNRSDETTVGNPIAGSGSVNQAGSGTTILTGANTYTGNTTVSVGTLVVNGSITSAVTVQPGGTLSGSGSVGAVTSAGTLAPGNTPETLTIAGDLMLTPTSILDFELDTPDVVGGGVNDLIEVNGNLTLDGILDIIDWGNYGAGTYRLINYTGSLTDNGLDIGTQPSGFNAELDTTTPGEVNLTVTASGAAGAAHPLPIFNLPGLLFLALLLAASGLGRLRIRSRI